MTNDHITRLVAGAIIVALFAAIVSVGYIVWLYRHRTRESAFFRMLVESHILKVIVGGGIIGIVAVASLADRRIFQPPWGAVVVGTGVIILLLPPIIHALTFARWRRRHDPNTPPPLRKQ